MRTQDARSTTELGEAVAQLVRTAAEERRTFLLSDDSGARAVLMDAASYDRWQDTVALLKMVAQSEEDVRAGRLIPQEEAFARAEKAIARASTDS